MRENSKDPFYERWWFIILTIILAVAIIEYFFDDSKQAQIERAEAIASAFQEEVVKEEIVENKPTPDVIAAYLIKKKFGSTKEEREKTVVSTDYINGEVEAIITATEVASAKTLKHSSLTSAVDFMELMKSQPNVNQATLIVEAPLTDPFGNVEFGDVMIVLISRETLNKINFQHFRPENLSTVADSYWEHPVLSVK